MWSKAQQAALAFVPKVSSLLSLFGSIWISAEVVTDSEIPKLRHPYHRLLLAMSVYDILESVWNFMSTWTIPKGTEGVWDPRGNTQTCTAQGFFLTLSVAVPLYNAFLSVYYMLVINYRFSDDILKKRVEPAFHLIAFVWAFGTALVAAWMGMINNANLWCWIAPHPSDCKDSRRYGDEANCERGDNAWIYRWVFYFAPLWFCILVATICTIKVYSKVQRYDQRSLRYRKPENGSFMGIRWVDNAGGAGQSRQSIVLSRKCSSQKMEADARSIRDEEDCRSDRSLDDFGAGVSPAPRLDGLEQIAEEEVDDEAVPASTLQQKSPKFAITVERFRRWREHRQQFAKDNPRTTEVRQQALWYLLAFYITHIWSTTNRIIQQSNHGKTYFGLILVHSFFDPLQGFLNFLVYQRPRYLRVRKQYPALTRLEAIKQVLRFSYLPAPQRPPSRRHGISGFVSQQTGDRTTTQSIPRLNSSVRFDDSIQSQSELVAEVSGSNIILEEIEKDLPSKLLVFPHVQSDVCEPSINSCLENVEAASQSEKGARPVDDTSDSFAPVHISYVGECGMHFEKTIQGSSPSITVPAVKVVEPAVEASQIKTQTQSELKVSIIIDNGRYHASDDGHIDTLNAENLEVPNFGIARVDEAKIKTYTESSLRPDVDTSRSDECAGQ
ncbi:hypothetical protein ACA910_016265 [Epithemia clementina (nom. ined.)]